MKMTMTTRDRLSLLADCSALFEAWTGPFDLELLRQWMVAEFAHEDVLERVVPHGTIRKRALVPENLLHVVSGNTPHAAFQSLLRGMVLGARNTVKLPSCGLPDFERAVGELPAPLADLVSVQQDLQDDWRSIYRTIVIFGSDETLCWFRAGAPPTTRLLLHGQKLSIALVSGDLENAARLAAHDVSQFDQQGCLSIHDIYLAPEAGLTPHAFAERLAPEMQAFNDHTPRAVLSDADSGSITALRESVRFSAASQPEDFALRESEGSTAWTVIAESSPLLKVSPLNRVVYVKPWPASASELGPERLHLASLALHPLSDEPDPTLLSLGANRICPLGQTQNPSLFWHHDGVPPLASLVTWIDLG